MSSNFSVRFSEMNFLRPLELATAWETYEKPTYATLPSISEASLAT